MLLLCTGNVCTHKVLNHPREQLLKRVSVCKTYEEPVLCKHTLEISQSVCLVDYASVQIHIRTPFVRVQCLVNMNVQICRWCTLACRLCSLMCCAADQKVLRIDDDQHRNLRWGNPRNVW